MKIRFNTFLFISTIFSTTAIYAQNCNPTGCPVTCSPACSNNDVCTIGSMITCGVCPSSKCISRVALGLPPLSNSTDTVSSNNNAGLIGGLVGGLLGGGLLLCAVGYFIFKRRNKTLGNLPLAFRSKQTAHLDRSVIPASIMTAADEEMQEQRAISGVIPVTFIPPSSTTNSVIHTRNSYMSHPDSFVSSLPARDSTRSFATTLSDLNEDDDPFSDRPISNLTNNTYSRRGSTESQVVQQVATVVQRAATQITRAKPQIMRVNTVVKNDGVTRQGSLKRIQPASVTLDGEEENPFDDKNRAALTTTKPNTATATNSVMSAPGDGEITIFWNGS